MNRDIDGEILGLFKGHLAQLERTAVEPEMFPLLREFEQTIQQALPLISEKVALTLSDGQLHSFKVGGGGKRLLLVVYVIPASRQNARAWLARGSPPTYTEIVANIYKGLAVKMTKEMGATTLVHVVICADAGGSPLWINLCLVPLTRDCPWTHILPDELLSEAERSDWNRLLGK